MAMVTPVTQNDPRGLFSLSPLERRGWFTLVGSSIASVGAWTAVAGFKTQSPLIGAIGGLEIITGVSVASRGGGLAGAVSACTSSVIAGMAARQPTEAAIKAANAAGEEWMNWISRSAPISSKIIKNMSDGNFGKSKKRFQELSAEGIGFLGCMRQIIKPTWQIISPGLQKTTKGIASAMIGATAGGALEDNNSSSKRRKCIVLLGGAAITVGVFFYGAQMIDPATYSKILPLGERLLVIGQSFLHLKNTRIPQ